MGYLEGFFGLIGDLTWGWALIPLLVVFGIFITLLTGFVQFRYFKRMFRVLSSKNQSGDPNAISAREALLISVGGRVGGGNIAGVAVAITLGGPGAVFWMWAIAIVGMATSLVECSLAQLYKRRDAGRRLSAAGRRARSFTGSAPNIKWLAVVYAVCLIAAFGAGLQRLPGQHGRRRGPGQPRHRQHDLDRRASLTILTGFIVYGGIHRIAKAADIVVPIMALGYILMALVIIVMNIGSLPGVIGEHLRQRFRLRRSGRRRHGRSHRAGAAARPLLQRGGPRIGAQRGGHRRSSPSRSAQGITQSFSVFIDTIIICSCTAFVILLGDAYVPGAAEVDGVVLTQDSLASHRRRLGGVFPDLRDPALRLQLDHLQLLPG